MKKEMFFNNLSRRKSIWMMLMVIFLCLCALCSYAENPIVNYVFTADPSGFVANDRLYVICSHDLDDQTNYSMYDYYLFSTTDLINWQDHGIVME